MIIILSYSATNAKYSLEIKPLKNLCTPLTFLKAGSYYFFSSRPLWCNKPPKRNFFPKASLLFKIQHHFMKFRHLRNAPHQLRYIKCQLKNIDNKVLSKNMHKGNKKRPANLRIQVQFQ